MFVNDPLANKSCIFKGMFNNSFNVKISYIFNFFNPIDNKYLWEKSNYLPNLQHNFVQWIMELFEDNTPNIWWLLITK